MIFPFPICTAGQVSGITFHHSQSRNYVMSPLVWEPSVSVKCPIFGGTLRRYVGCTAVECLLRLVLVSESQSGSAWDFAAAYREEFNEETDAGYELNESFQATNC